MRPSFLLVPAFVALSCLPASLCAEEATPATQAAHRLWAVTDVVLEEHVAPPARQQMLLDAIATLALVGGEPVPEGLPRRASAIAGRDDFAKLVAELWPEKAPADLESNVLAGMLARLPGGGRVVPAENLRINEQLEANRYVGIGIQLSFHNGEGYSQITTPFRRGPAHKAGARPGDLIVSIDGKDVRKVPLGKIVQLLRGDKGSKLTVGVRRPGAKEVRELRMTRDVVPMQTVVGYRRGDAEDWAFRTSPDGPVAYAAITSFRVSTLHELRQLERQARKEGARGLVLDLRFTPGGVLSHGALVADAFLEEGVLWRLRGRAGKVTETRADRDVIFRDWPVVLLVGEGSGTVSRWVAAALQDHKRAVIVGEAVRGEAYARRRLALPDGGALVLATSIIERPRPAERGPGAAGLRPPPVLALTPDEDISLTRKQREALLRHQRLKDFTELPKGVKDEHPEDGQLARALDLVRRAVRPRTEG